MIYADNVRTISIVGQNARIQFEAVMEASKEGENTQLHKERTATVVMPIQGLGQLLGILEQLKQQIEAKREEDGKDTKST